MDQKVDVLEERMNQCQHIIDYDGPLSQVAARCELVGIKEAINFLGYSWIVHGGKYSIFKE